MIFEDFNLGSTYEVGSLLDDATTLDDLDNAFNGCNLEDHEDFIGKRLPDTTAPECSSYQQSEAASRKKNERKPSSIRWSTRSLIREQLVNYENEETLDDSDYDKDYHPSGLDSDSAPDPSDSDTSKEKQRKSEYRHKGKHHLSNKTNQKRLYAGTILETTT